MHIPMVGPHGHTRTALVRLGIAAVLSVHLALGALMAGVALASTSLTFDDHSIGLISGDYPASPNSIITFPSDFSWKIDGSYGPDTTHTLKLTVGASFDFDSNSSFHVIGSHILTSFDLVNTTSDVGSFSLSCGGQPTVSDNIPTTASRTTYFTGWSAACGLDPTFTLSAVLHHVNGAHLDNLVFDGGTALGALGTTTIGSTAGGTASGTVAYPFTPTSVGLVDRFNLYIDTGGSTTSGIIQVGVYDDSGGAPHNLIIPPSPCNLGDDAGSNPGWHQCVLRTSGGGIPAPALSLTSGTQYWLAYAVQTTSWGAALRFSNTTFSAPHSNSTSLPAVWDGAGATCGCGGNPSFFMDFSN